MPRSAKLLSILLTGFFAAGVSAAQGSEEALVQRVDEMARAAVEAPGAVGLSVALAVGDEILLSRGYGLAEVEHGVPVDEETMFRIGSITKQFTGAAIARLSEQWKLDIDEDMTVYLPDYPTHGHTVTVRHLLTHTSGIPSYTGLGEVFWRNAAIDLTHEELLGLFKDKPFEFEPGTGFHYNNSGYYLLGMIIEQVSELPYDLYMQQELFEPLGLERTRYGSNADIIRNRAQGYRMVDGDLENDQLLSMNQPGAAGALLSTAGDLVRWQLALVGGEVVEPESYAEMTTPFLLEDGSGTETSYGFGLSLGEHQGHPVVQHGGGINGFNSFLMYLPEQELSVCVISNSEDFSSQVLAASIATHAVDEAPKILAASSGE